MVYLFAQIFLLLVAAALFGALCSYFWFRRSFEDVTESYALLEEQRSSGAFDLSPLSSQLTMLEASINGMKPQDSPDVEGVDRRLAKLEALINGLTVPQSPDFGGIDDRLAKLEAKLDSMSGKVACPTLEGIDARIDELAGKKPTSFAAERRDDGSKNLLRRAAFGHPDDLKKISGVGPVLEAMLHELGVYYFWQVSDWTPEDIAFVDARLTAFKGRIERDNWVSQAVGLAKAGAPRPKDAHAATNGNGWGVPAPSSLES